MRTFYIFLAILLSGIGLSVFNVINNITNTPGITINNKGIQLSNEFILASIQRQLLASITAQALLISILLVLVIDRYDNVKFRKSILTGEK